jgi:hypothetical protein
LALKAGQGIGLLTPEMSGAVLTHPAHQANIRCIAQLIAWLRACEKKNDFYEFQRHLFGDLQKAEERRAQCSRIIKRFRTGRSLPRDAPPSPASGDPAQLDSWEFEAFVHERIARQLRTVGDGLAWRCFGYDRRMILTLSRNDSAGPMFGKEGLPYELRTVTELWDNDGHFSLLHDLTNCLRIADLTEFTDNGGAVLREIKRKPRTDKKQVERVQAAVNTIMHGGPLPGDRPNARLVELAEPYATNLKQLGDLIELARQHGCRGMKLPHGRALIALWLPVAERRWSSDYEKGLQTLESTRQRAIKRAGIATASHHIKGVSGDTASRCAIMAPWSIYPFTPQNCAAIICDLLIFEITISVDDLIASLERVGLHGEILLPADHGQVSGDMNILRVHWRDRALTLHAAGLNVLLYELVQPDVWARGMREVLTLPDPPGEPALVFAREADTWCQET